MDNRSRKERHDPKDATGARGAALDLGMRGAYRSSHPNGDSGLILLPARGAPAGQREVLIDEDEAIRLLQLQRPVVEQR